MPLKVLIAPDKFKGTLAAAAAAAAIARGWRAGRPMDELELLPISDGGDGFGGALSGLLRAGAQMVSTVDAAHRRLRARWWWEPESKTAIIESANVIGLALMPAKKFHPFALDTFGLGAVIRAAVAKGARRCFIGIGGSATNDGGFGVARALGWEFLDGAGNPVMEWTRLDELAELRPPKERRRKSSSPHCTHGLGGGNISWTSALTPSLSAGEREAHPPAYGKDVFSRGFGSFTGRMGGLELIVAVDVRNPLLGARGCTRIYGPQKGLATGDFAKAESCLRRLARVAREQLGRDGAGERGAGAAGGLGFGLRCFLGARLQPGFDLIARQTGLDRRLRAADLVITGEGAIDASTLMGKGVGELAARCFRLGIPCIGLGGNVAMARGGKQKYFARLHGLTELTGEKNARRNAALWLERLARRVAGSF